MNFSLKITVIDRIVFIFSLCKQIEKTVKICHTLFSVLAQWFYNVMKYLFNILIFQSTSLTEETPEKRKPFPSRGLGQTGNCVIYYVVIKFI